VVLVHLHVFVEGYLGSFALVDLLKLGTHLKEVLIRTVTAIKPRRYYSEKKNSSCSMWKINWWNLSAQCNLEMGSLNTAMDGGALKIIGLCE
jgi:hypothetical protein